eukprot:3474048-Amphidinium_carterae.1
MNAFVASRSVLMAGKNIAKSLARVVSGDAQTLPFEFEVESLSSWVANVSSSMVRELWRQILAVLHVTASKQSPVSECSRATPPTIVK